MTDPRHHTDANGGRHTTHADIELSDEIVEEEFDLDSFFDWGFDAPEDLDGA